MVSSYEPWAGGGGLCVGRYNSTPTQCSYFAMRQSLGCILCLTYIKGYSAMQRTAIKTTGGGMNPGFQPLFTFVSLSFPLSICLSVSYCPRDLMMITVNITIFLQRPCDLDPVHVSKN